VARPIPFVKLMYAARERLESGDLLATAVGMPDLKLRWARNRYATREERPCLSIAFVSDEPADDGRFPANMDETVRILALDLIVDLAVETEASAEANMALGTPPEEFDPSGLEVLAWVAATALRLLREACDDPLRDVTDLGRMCDWIQDVGIDDDEDLPDDDGRLVDRVNVIYRVHSVDPTVLLER
jgi:hypothetical protein